MGAMEELLRLGLERKVRKTRALYMSEMWLARIIGQ